MTPAWWAEAKRLRDKGLSSREVGRIVGKSHMAVLRAWKPLFREQDHIRRQRPHYVLYARYYQAYGPIRRWPVEARELYYKEKQNASRNAERGCCPYCGRPRQRVRSTPDQHELRGGTQEGL